jgi:hypothetical protein
VATSMTTSRRFCRTPARVRAALELLAASRDGCTEAILRAHGVIVAQMVELVRAKLATATAERVVADGKAIEVATVRITDARRQALVERRGRTRGDG